MLDAFFFQTTMSNNSGIISSVIISAGGKKNPFQFPLEIIKKTSSITRHTMELGCYLSWVHLGCRIKCVGCVRAAELLQLRSLDVRNPSGSILDRNVFRCARDRWRMTCKETMTVNVQLYRVIKWDNRLVLLDFFFFVKMIIVGSLSVFYVVKNGYVIEIF